MPYKGYTKKTVVKFYDIFLAKTFTMVEENFNFERLKSPRIRFLLDMNFWVTENPKSI